MELKIQNAYDSHTHFWATGQVACGLNLNSLKSPEEVRDIEIKPEYFRAGWLVGFGWNQNQWMSKNFPHKKILDQIFPDIPVFFSRVDGHASWLNSKAISELRRLGFDFEKEIIGGIINRDESGAPTGTLLDQAHINALMLLPDFSKENHIKFLKTSQNIFNSAGFTHVRDMSMNSYFWNLLCELEHRRELNVAIDAFVTVENIHHLDKTLFEINKMKAEKTEQLRLNGVKIFIDGSLGSKTAYLTQPYLGSDKNGLLIWNYEDIKSLIKHAFMAGQEVAIHTIGNAAVETALRAAREVSADGVLGRLHLEHVQLLSNEAIKLMKPLHVTCHMQPCHWLSDHSWLDKVLPKSLMNQLFQWQLLQKNKIPFFFGSDSPIESPSLFVNIKALQESAVAGVPELSGSWVRYHTHPDPKFSPSYTRIDSEKILEVRFRDRQII